MSASLTNIGAITMFSADPKVSKEFYERVFGAKVVYEDEVAVAFKFDTLVINLLKITQAPELIEPAVVADASSGSRHQIALSVDDVDAVCAELTAKGVDLINGPMDRPWGIRTACFADPDGHNWEIGQQL